MKNKKCMCGKKLQFRCSVEEGDEIWFCPSCGGEYIYNSVTDELYTPDKYGCC